MSGRASSSGTAPSTVVSSSARTVKMPSAVRTFTARRVAASKTARGAEVARARPVPSGSQLGAGETSSVRARIAAKVTRNRSTSALDGRAIVRRRRISALRSSSLRIPRATARLAPTSDSAARYDEPLPPNREAMIRRSTASTCVGLTACRSRSRSRSRARTTQRSKRKLPVARQLRQCSDGRRSQRLAAVHAPDSGSEVDLTGPPVGVELLRREWRAHHRGSHSWPTARRTRRTSCRDHSSARCAEPSPTTRRETAEAHGKPDPPPGPATSRRRTSASGASILLVPPLRALSGSRP